MKTTHLSPCLRFSKLFFAFPVTSSFTLILDYSFKSTFCSLTCAPSRKANCSAVIFSFSHFSPFTFTSLHFFRQLLFFSPDTLMRVPLISQFSFFSFFFLLHFYLIRALLQPGIPPFISFFFTFLFFCECILYLKRKQHEL